MGTWMSRLRRISIDQRRKPEVENRRTNRNHVETPTMQRAAERHDACEKTIADAAFQQLRAPSHCLEMRIVPGAREATGAAGADSGARQEAGERFFHQHASLAQIPYIVAVSHTRNCACMIGPEGG